MKLKELYVDGFGIFHDYHLKGLNPGINVITGMNEDGKSTLLAFIRRIMFGFPDRRSKRNPYPVISGGVHGGRLVFVSDEDRRFIVERYSQGTGEPVVIAPDGSKNGAEELSRILGYANETIYLNIYAFGLSELQDFQSLSSEGLKARLYSAGTGTGGQTLMELQNYLKKQSEELYKPQGTKPQINQLLKEIKDVSVRLKETRGNVDKFDNLHLELNEISKKVKSVDFDRNLSRKEFYHLKNLQVVWEDYRKMKEAEERLAEIPLIDKFPENGIEILSSNLEKILGLEERIKNTTDEIEGTKIQKSLIRLEKKVIRKKSEIMAFQKGLDKYSSALEDLPVLIEQLKQKELALNGILQEIGPNWNSDKVVQFDLSIPVKEEVRSKQNIIQKLEKERQGIENTKQELKRRIKVEAKKMEELKNNITELPEQKLKQELQEKKKILIKLRIKFPDFKKKEERISALEEYRKLEGNGIPRQLILLLSLAAISVMAFFILVIFQKSLGLGIGFVFFLFLVLVLYLIYEHSKHRKKISKPFSKDPQGYADLRSEFNKLYLFMQEEAKKCGFDSVPTSADLEEKDRELQRDLDNIRISEEINIQVKKQDQELEQLQGELEGMLQAQKKIELQYNSAREEWKNWLLTLGLDPESSPEGVMDIFISLKAAREYLKSMDLIKDRIGNVQEIVHSYDSGVTTLIKECGVESKSNDTAVNIENLAVLADKAFLDSKKLEHLTLDEEKLRSEIKNLEGERKDNQTYIDGLLMEAEVESVHLFREKAANWEKRVRLSKDKSQHEENIKRISGDGDSYQRYLSELSDLSQEELDEMLTRSKEQFDQLEEEWRHLIENRGRICTQIEQLEKEEETASLLLSQSVQLEKLKNHAESWAVLLLAKKVLQEAIEKYEKERQPKVIKAAQNFFEKMTLGRYSRIYAPQNESRIFVESTQDKNRKDIYELSRGTAEQLYLALRFGFVQEFSRRAEALPVIFDDILVNFDPKRSRAACEAIQELSQTNQVIYFTCHPDTANLLVEQSKRADVFEIK